MILRAKDVMTRNLITLRANYSVNLAKEIFISKKITGAPVLDDDENLIGIVSLFDLTCCLEKDLEKPISEIMSPHVKTAEAETSLEIIAKTMIEEHIHRLIIIKPGTSQPVGLVSSFDLLKFLAWESIREKNGLPNHAINN